MTGFYGFDELHLLLTLQWTNHPCHSNSSQSIFIFPNTFNVGRSPPVSHHSDTMPITALGPTLTHVPGHLLPPSQPNSTNALGCSHPDIPRPNQLLTPDPGLTPSPPPRLQGGT